MSNDESTYARELADGERAAPTSVVIAAPDGRRIACLVTQKDRDTWLAEPPEPYRLQGGERLLIDRLPAGGAVEFVNVYGPGGEDWGGRSAARPDA